MTEIDHETAKDVLEEVVDLSFARGYLAEGGASFAREALEKALGPIRAAEILPRLVGRDRGDAARVPAPHAARPDLGVPPQREPADDRASCSPTCPRPTSPRR